MKTPFVNKINSTVQDHIPVFLNDTGELKDSGISINNLSDINPSKGSVNTINVSDINSKFKETELIIDDGKTISNSNADNSKKVSLTFDDINSELLLKTLLNTVKVTDTNTVLTKPLKTVVAVNDDEAPTLSQVMNLLSSLNTSALGTTYSSNTDITITDGCEIFITGMTTQASNTPLKIISGGGEFNIHVIDYPVDDLVTNTTSNVLTNSTELSIPNVNSEIVTFKVQVLASSQITSITVDVTTWGYDVGFISKKQYQLSSNNVRNFKITGTLKNAKIKKS